MNRALSAARGVCWAATAEVALRGISGTLNTAASLRWLIRHGTGGAAAAPVERPYVVVVLPMLREQRILNETLQYFSDLTRTPAARVSIALVTSQREHAERAQARQRLPELAEALSAGAAARVLRVRFAGILPGDRLAALASAYAGRGRRECEQAAAREFADSATTNELAERAAAQARAQGRPVRHCDYPDGEGAMAHQVNFAAAREIERLRCAGVAPASVWIAMYNADSRPHPGTIPTLAAHIAQRAAQGCPPRIVQQSALFTGNRRELSPVLAGAGLLQSRWTLAREIPRLRRQARHATRAGRTLPPLAHCVGHGLFVRADAFTTRGGLPTATMNEDLAFGYLTCAAGTPIEPLPLLERADSPQTLPALVRQQRQWFWSYPQYPRAAALAARAGLGTRVSRVWLTSHGLLRGGLWLGQSPTIAAALALPLLERRPRAVVAATAALALYLAAPLILATRHPATSDGHAVSARELAGALAACLVATTGPWWCAANAADACLRGTRYPHAKTER